MIGEPGGQSTPVPSPERPKNSEMIDTAVVALDVGAGGSRKVSRFDVKKVSEEREGDGSAGSTCNQVDVTATAAVNNDVTVGAATTTTAVVGSVSLAKHASPPVSCTTTSG